MMYVKHFVICKALCTCVWVTALVVIILTVGWDPCGVRAGEREGQLLGLPQIPPRTLARLENMVDSFSSG